MRSLKLASVSPVVSPLYLLSCIYISVAAYFNEPVAYKTLFFRFPVWSDLRRILLGYNTDGAGEGTDICTGGVFYAGRPT